MREANSSKCLRRDVLSSAPVTYMGRESRCGFEAERQRPISSAPAQYALAGLPLPPLPTAYHGTVLAACSVKTGCLKPVCCPLQGFSRKCAWRSEHLLRPRGNLQTIYITSNPLPQTLLGAAVSGGVCGVRAPHAAQGPEGGVSGADPAGVPARDEADLQHAGGGKCYLRARRETQPV